MAYENMDLTHLTPDEKINGIGSLMVPNYLRNKVHGQDVRETMAQLAEMIIQLGINLGLDPDDALEWARKLQESVSQSEFDSWVATLLDGGPSLFFETKAALVANYPNGAPGVALVRETDPAKIYVWNGSSWEDFGDYQGIEIADGSITSKKIANGAISANKLSIVEVTSKNKFNPESVELGILLADGTVGTSSGSTVFYTSDFMRFNPNEVVTTNLNLQSSAAYDRSGRKISVTLNALHTQVIMPSNGYYLKVTRPEDRINEFMVVSGEMPSTYDPFRSTIDEQYIPSISGENIKDNSITTDKVDFIVKGKNLIDVTKFTKGKYVNNLKGILSDNSDYEASEIIPVVAGEKLTISNVPLVEVRHAFYSAANNFIKGAVSVPMPLTATQDGYFRFSYRIGGKPMIEKGEIATTYEPYKEILKGVTIEGTDTGSGNNDFKVNFTLSPKIYGVVGQELNIYFKNIIDQKDTSLDFDVSSSFGKQMTDRLTGVPEQATTTTIGISAYKDHEQVGAGSTSLVTTNIATKDVKVLYFGDSTVNAGGVTKRLLDLYSAESSSLTLLGTRGLDSTNRYEGRGGWSGVTYRTPTEIYGAGNPFYNPAKSDFDFNYYMTQQGYSGLDHFIIQLGINDTFGMTSDETLQTKIDTILSDFDYIINDVKSYDSNIKVGMTVTIPPNASQDAFGTVYGTGQTQWRYKRNNALWVPRLIDHYKDKESQGIYLVPMQHNIDTVNNIADGVHPTQTGYDQMGDSVYAYLKNIG